ncbi:hypothetical protein ACP70R_005023 [Stipagrostis hirtigluma subsp. patula]
MAATGRCRESAQHADPVDPNIHRARRPARADHGPITSSSRAGWGPLLVRSGSGSLSEPLPFPRALLCSPLLSSIKGGALAGIQPPHPPHSRPKSIPLSRRRREAAPPPEKQRPRACPRLRSAREELAAHNKLEEGRRGDITGGIGVATGGGGETEEQRNRFLVLRLYEALNARDNAAVQALLAPDLEWWFHGPPTHQHMMRILTGRGGSSFRFVPRSVDAFGSTVIAEGPPDSAAQGGGGGAYWVHAWTVGADGVITQLREYFNTDLTVTRLAAATTCVWQSHRPDSDTNSLPGLVLAI